MSTVLTTVDVRARDRHAYWVDAVCDTYVQLECDPRDDGAHFSGEIRFDRLATLGLSRVTATAQVVRRTPAKIADAAEDFVLASIQTAGRGRITQDGRVAELKPGDFALYDSTRPYELAFDGRFQQFVLMLPGPVLRSQLAETRALTARTVSGERGAGHLVISMIRTLAQDIGTLEPTSAAAVADSIGHILIAGLRTLPGTAPPAPATLAAWHRERVKADVRAHLRDPRLSALQIAARLQVSPSTVHRAFAGEPMSLTDWIWMQRLDGAKGDLCNPALTGRTISEIAFGWGFNDAAHFSRAFRARFGCAPRDVRAGTTRPD